MPLQIIKRIVQFSAMRFAIIEAKAAICHLIHNFRLEPCSKTDIPFKKSGTSTILKPANGMWLKFQERDHANGEVSNGFVKV